VPLDWLHLMSGSIWVGGLLGLLVVWRSLPAARRVAGLVVCVPRFSNVAFVSVLTLLGTGVGASVLHLPVLSALWQTSYGEAILVKAGILVAAMLHNAIGYLFGYWLARAVRLDEITCRTIALEVGMQNGGMASGLALGVLKSADAALAPAIFGPWMNISGSILASWWRRRPVPGSS